MCTLRYYIRWIVPGTLQHDIRWYLEQLAHGIAHICQVSLSLQVFSNSVRLLGDRSMAGV